MSKLTKRQEDTLKKHKKHHSLKHMRMMRTLMMKGDSFSTAHSKTQKKIGS